MRTGLAGLALVSASALPAQVKPNSNWRTIRTEHFYIHFTPELETVARRAATQAEDAYVEISRHLARPRGKIDIVLSDDVDYANGWATPFPSNRIGIYAHPPVFENALRFNDDPIKLVITHELVHIFHLDRAGGVWRLLQRGFGRVPYFFPNAEQPRWLVEGLAVYYESKLTGSGRVEGSEHDMVARTAALAHHLPRIDQLSLANPRFPYGASTYIYGSLFLDYLARTQGDSTMKKFVEASSRQLIPMWLNWPARRAFGKRFNTLYRSFTDSLLRSATFPYAPPMPAWRDLTVDGAYANFPRWFNDSSLVYTGTPGRETYGAYRLTFSDSRPRLPTPAKRERLGRRHTRSPNTILLNGALLYSELEYTGPYTIRSDLYIAGTRGGTLRLTKNARLAIPDARSDGLIVAVQTVPAGTRIALVSFDGRRITPITSGGQDEQWTEPRWSPSGTHIAAIRWTRGGTSEVVVLDTAGIVVETLVRERTVNAAPSWSPDGRYVFFSSDRSGITNVYRAPFRAASADSQMVSALERVSDTQTGLFEPQLSPSGREMAAVVFRTDGYHIGVAPIDSIRPEPAPVIESVAPRDPESLSPEPRAQSPVHKYSPWRSLAPTSWLPFYETALDSNSLRLGAFVSGSDVVGRHAYQALLFVPTDNSGLTGTFAYRNASLGRPLIDLFASQDWTNRGCILDASQQNRCIGTLRRRIRDATLAFTFPRPRVRTFSYFSVGAGIDVRDYATDSTSLLLRIDSVYRRTYYYPRATFSAGWSNTQHPPLSISPEDGFSVAGTARYRRRLYDTTSLTSSFVGSAAGYKSLDLPGFGHHVIAVRAAGGVQDNRGTGYFEVGGVSGGTLDVVPGYVLGEGRRTFGVRGFPAASLLGIRAYQGSAEYRAPLALPGRGLGTLPLFFDRTSLTLFGDIGSAWCPGVYATRPAPSTSLCTSPDVDARFAYLQAHPIASVGAELNVSAAILSWDAPFRYRFGFAAPVLGTEYVFGEQKPTVYFTVGVPF